MKKLFSILLLLIAFAFSADVKPFYFENVPDSAQQTSWETLMQYKTFGAYELTFGNELIRITDKAGWIGTSKGNLTMGQNGKDTLGGPIVIGGDLIFRGRNEVFSTGPVIVNGNIIVSGDRAGFHSDSEIRNIFSGYQCISGSVDEQYVKFIPEEYRFFSEDYDKCPLDSTYVNDTSLTVPILKNDTAVYVSLKDLDSTFSGGMIKENTVVTINVPVGSYKEPYDIYIDKIAFSNDGKLVVKQQQGGRLTRIFLRDGNGNVVTDAIAEIRDNSTKIISVDNYIENYCTDQYKEEVRKKGIENVPFYDMQYTMHVWIFNNNAEYVNDFNFKYTIDEKQKVDAAGMLNLMVDWLAAKDGYVKAKNNKNIGTGAYLTKLEAKSVSTAKCSLNANTQKGTKIKKTEYDLTSFGYKRPTHK